MKILIVDYLSYPGHKRFNKIHIDALEGLGHDLFFVGKKDQFPDSCEPRLLCIPPDIFFKSLPLQSLSSRIQNILCLKWVYSHVHEEDFDLILFPTYDIVSLFFSPFKNKCLVINHNNVSQLNSRIKAWMTRHLPLSVSHITLDSLSQKRLQEVIPNAKVYMIPHGFDKPSNNISKPEWLDCDTYFFCPVNRNFNQEDVNKLFQNSLLHEVLKKARSCIYIKNFSGIENSSVLKIIPSNVPQKEYDYMIQKAKAVILPYNSSFRYRVSGIFFECLASNTPVIVPKIDSFIQYNDLNAMCYSDTRDFVNKVEESLIAPSLEYDSTRIMPTQYWDSVIRDI